MKYQYFINILECKQPKKQFRYYKLKTIYITTKYDVIKIKRKTKQLDGHWLKNVEKSLLF